MGLHSHSLKQKRTIHASTESRHALWPARPLMRLTKTRPLERTRLLSRRCRNAPVSFQFFIDDDEVFVFGLTESDVAAESREEVTSSYSTCPKTLPYVPSVCSCNVFTGYSPSKTVAPWVGIVKSESICPGENHVLLDKCSKRMCSTVCRGSRNWHCVVKQFEPRLVCCKPSACSRDRYKLDPQHYILDRIGELVKRVDA